MSRSNRTTRSTRTARKPAARKAAVVAVPAVAVAAPAQVRNSVGDNTVRRSRRLKNYSFHFSRNSTAHAAGTNGVRIDTRDGDTIKLSLQEARSLYSFLSETLDG